MNGSSRTQGLRGPSDTTGTPRQAAVAADRNGRHSDSGPAARAVVLAAIAGFALCACAETGDFGRPKASVWNNLILPSSGEYAARERGEPVSAYPLTDLERELRDRSWRFLMPEQERSWFEQNLFNLARTRIRPASEQPRDPRSYYASLVGQPFASPASRYRRIGEDAEADLVLIAPFGAVAERVIATDRARLGSLAYVHDLTDRQVADASARVIENRCLVAWVRSALRDRTEAYRYALEHAFVAMPQEEAAETERSVRALDRHRHILDALPVPPWRDGVCLTAAVEPLPRRAKPLVVKD